MPDGGARCEIEAPTYLDAGDGHRILCHLPLETLQHLEPVVSAG